MIKNWLVTTRTGQMIFLFGFYLLMWFENKIVYYNQGAINRREWRKKYPISGDEPMPVMTMYNYRYKSRKVGVNIYERRRTCF